jgi:hypothetical protein
MVLIGIDPYPYKWEKSRNWWAANILSSSLCGLILTMDPWTAWTVAKNHTMNWQDLTGSDFLLGQRWPEVARVPLKLLCCWSCSEIASFQLSAFISQISYEIQRFTMKSKGLYVNSQWELVRNGQALINFHSCGLYMKSLWRCTWFCLKAGQCTPKFHGSLQSVSSPKTYPLVN